jgi:hypothetical protein
MLVIVKKNYAKLGNEAKGWLHPRVMVLKVCSSYLRLYSSICPISYRIGNSRLEDQLCVANSSPLDSNLSFSLRITALNHYPFCSQRVWLLYIYVYHLFLLWFGYERPSKRLWYRRLGSQMVDPVIEAIGSWGFWLNLWINPLMDS